MYYINTNAGENLCNLIWLIQQMYYIVNHYL